LYVVADLESAGGLDLVKEALTSLVCICLEIQWVYSNHSLLQAPDSKARLAFVHNPSTAQSPTVDHEHPFPGFSLTFTRKLLSNAPPSPLLSALGLDVPAALTDGPQIPICGKTAFEKVTGGVDLKDIPTKVYDDYPKSSRLLSRNIKLKPGPKAIAVNAWVIGPIEGNDFLAVGFRALEDSEFRSVSSLYG